MNVEILLLIMFVGFMFSFLIGDPPNKFHPVAWLGYIANFFIPKLKRKESPIFEKLNGITFIIFLTILSFLIMYYLSIQTYIIFGLFGFIFYSVLVLKFTVPIITMEKHVDKIISSLQKNDIESARNNLSFIVSRNTDDLDQEHIISGTIESIGENTVDGIISPLFYFSLFGPMGAVTFRIINTLDSMMGYTNNYYFNIGWMAAKADTIANYLPSRTCAAMMIISAKIIGADWKNSIYVLRKDSHKALSINAGYPMSAMAGALRIKLEKIGQYELGLEIEHLSLEKCKIAISMMKVTAIINCIFVCTPIMVLLYLSGWWDFLFGF